LYLRNGILEINVGKRDHQVSVRTDRPAFNRLFSEAKTPSLADIGNVKGTAEAIARFDKAIDQTFYPIRLGVQ
jgi:hypothetical protein